MTNKFKIIKRVIILILIILCALFIASRFIKPPRDLSLANII